MYEEEDTLYSIMKTSPKNPYLVCEVGGHTVQGTSDTVI